MTGRGPVPVPPGPGAGLCADIGGSLIKGARARPDGTLGAVSRRPTPAGDWDAFVEALRALCEEGEPAEPLSVSVAGVIDPDTGLARSANVPCLTGRALGRELEAALGRPVRVANDADCFVLAEALRGAGAGHRNVFGIILGTGVGGGLVIDGRMVEGAGGIAGEWGHGPLLGTVMAGTAAIPPLPCGCGQRGCLDTLGSARGLERIDASVMGGGRDSRAILQAWRAGEAAARTAVAAWTELLAGPLAAMVNLTGAGVVPAGGGLSNDEALLAGLDAAVRARILRRADAPLVVPARLGEAAGLIGAALRLPLAEA